MRNNKIDDFDWIDDVGGGSVGEPFGEMNYDSRDVEAFEIVKVVMNGQIVVILMKIKDERLSFNDISADHRLTFELTCRDETLFTCTIYVGTNDGDPCSLEAVMKCPTFHTNSGPVDMKVMTTGTDDRIYYGWKGKAFNYEGGSRICGKDPHNRTLVLKPEFDTVVVDEVEEKKNVTELRSSLPKSNLGTVDSLGKDIKFLCRYPNGCLYETNVRGIGEKVLLFVFYRDRVIRKISQNGFEFTSLEYHPCVLPMLYSNEKVKYDSFSILPDYETNWSAFTVVPTEKRETGIQIFKHHTTHTLEELMNSSRVDGSGKLTYFEYVSILSDMISGACHLHKHRIVHRDLNPMNIFIDSNNGRCWVGGYNYAIDFKKLKSSDAEKKLRIPRFNSSDDIRVLYESIDNEDTLVLGGIKKMKKKDNQTLIYGYLPPEIRSFDPFGHGFFRDEGEWGEKRKFVDYSKTDVYSVGIIGLELLSKKEKHCVESCDEKHKIIEDDVKDLLRLMTIGSDDDCIDVKSSFTSIKVSFAARISIETAQEKMKKIREKMNKITMTTTQMKKKESPNRVLVVNRPPHSLYTFGAERRIFKKGYFGSMNRGTTKTKKEEEEETEGEEQVGLSVEEQKLKELETWMNMFEETNNRQKKLQKQISDRHRELFPGNEEEEDETTQLLLDNIIKDGMKRLSTRTSLDESMEGLLELMSSLQVHRKRKIFLDEILERGKFRLLVGRDHLPVSCGSCPGTVHVNIGGKGKVIHRCERNKKVYITKLSELEWNIIEICQKKKSSLYTKDKVGWRCLYTKVEEGREGRKLDSAVLMTSNGTITLIPVKSKEEEEEELKKFKIEIGCAVCNIEVKFDRRPSMGKEVVTPVYLVSHACKGKSRNYNVTSKELASMKISVSPKGICKVSWKSLFTGKSTDKNLKSNKKTQLLHYGKLSGTGIRLYVKPDQRRM